MNILIFGCGGREHCIIKHLEDDNIYCITGSNNYNYKIAEDCKKFVVLSNITKELVSHYIRIWNIDYAVVGPESLLNKGIPDILYDLNIPCIGPRSLYARIETDKVYARNLLKDNGLGKYNPEFVVISNWTDHNNMITHLDAFKGNYVIKPSGLHGGKGVKISGEHILDSLEALELGNQLIKQNEPFLIEEKLIGEEFSLMSFTDGVTVRHMPLVRDFKRVFDGDRGPNTGSMGSISYADHKLPFLSDDEVIEARCVNNSVIKILNNTIESEGYYKGILYGSFMKTETGIKVIEFNARFGDPECINVLSILETPLSDIFVAINNNKLSQVDISYSNLNSVCKYLVPMGYPNNSEFNKVIQLPDILLEENNLYFSSISKSVNNMNFTGSSRTLAYCLTDESLEKVAEDINIFFNKFKGPLHYRRDIGLKKVENSLKYSDCGVDIDEANRSFSLMVPHIQKTYNEQTVTSVGDFGGIIDMSHMNSLLISSTDGVGTKNDFVYEYFGLKNLSTLGEDIVNHCVNDILVKGATPSFFLDYLGFGKLDAEIASDIVSGMSKACVENNCVLIGGETAEMPGTYYPNKFDIVGTIIGSVNQKDLIMGKMKITSGDKILALPSSGPHTNGFSLIRKVLQDHEAPHNILEYFKTPHRSYLNQILKLREKVKILGLCHITGGGLIENPPRVASNGLGINLFKSRWDMPEGFKFIQEKGNISDYEMYRTFNCGIGMLIYLEANDVEIALDLLKDDGIFEIGEVVEDNNKLVNFI